MYLLTLKDAETARKFEDAKFGVECASLVIVIAFVLEIPLNLWMYGIRHYLKSCVETFDALVCILSFAADVYVIVLTTRERAEENAALEEKQARTSNSTLCLGGKEKSAPIAEAAGLLILFRLWRIVRIVNGTSF
ncbi:unnamed protein product [Dibothriocephalus latus]|uniref:Voltage-gated hydrogen channel 1 n=1 Tax=Dibothriocephalus latus TaxID=60516 RepID=A0A3P7P3K7_DIBLA|nr:unnamed protein product [Dibothriocephalus latus]